MRADLLALDDDALATLANRGLVKRALREVAAGGGPALSDEDGTVTATFPDGTTVVLPAGATLEQASCTCAASGICRHRLMLVIAHRAVGEAETVAPDWSPATFTDAELEEHLGARTYAVARRALRSGYRARVLRPSAADPVTAVELAACTVRFLVPRELGYARVDAAAGARGDAIALAVWACRAADEADEGGDLVELQVGGEVVAAEGGSGVEPALALIADLLADGVAGTAPEAATAIAQARRAMDAANLRWPVDLLDDIAEQIEAYRARSARYDPVLVSAYVAESVARHRCVTGGGAALRVQVLGTEEPAETPLRLLRLTGLGARIRGDEHSRSVEVYLAHHEARVVLALRRRVDVEDGGEPPSAHDLGRRKAGGARLSALAAGNVVTESAVRSANRVVRIAESRVARTTVAPSAGRWDELPEGLLVDDLGAEAARLAGLPPALVRARVIAESVRAIRVEAVEDVHFRPGAQQLVATIRAAEGTARLVATHTSAAPGAIDALARSLSGEAGAVRFVAGHLRRHGGGIDVEPTAVAAGASVVVPAFADASGEAIDTTAGVVADRLAAEVTGALELTAEVVHRGHRHLPPGWPQRAERAAAGLRQVGLSSASAAVAAVATEVRAGGRDLFDRWADAHIRLLVTAEQI